MGRLKRAMSPELGGPPAGVQFAAVLKMPPEAFDQSKVVAVAGVATKIETRANKRTHGRCMANTPLFFKRSSYAGYALNVAAATRGRGTGSLWKVGEAMLAS